MSTTANERIASNRAVAHLSSAHPSTDTRIFHRECSSLARNGYRTALITAHGTEQVRHGVELLVVEAGKGRLSRATVTAARLLRRVLAGDFSVIHIHDPELLWVGFVLRMKGYSVIYDAHEDLPRQILTKHWIPKPFRRLIGRIVESVEDTMAARMSAVVAATPVIEDRFRRVNPVTITLNNFPDFEEVPLQTGSWAARPKCIAYVGAITPERGIFELIKAVERLQIPLSLAGIVATESLMAEISSMPGWKYVTYHGQVGREEVARILSSARIGICCLHPTENYLVSQPVKLFEYMAFGLPVIASDFEYWRDLVGADAGIRFVDPLSVSELVREIAALIQDDGPGPGMSAVNFALVRERFSWLAEEKKLVDLYRSLMPAER